MEFKHLKDWKERENWHNESTKERDWHKEFRRIEILSRGGYRSLKRRYAAKEI